MVTVMKSEVTVTVMVLATEVRKFGECGDDLMVIWCLLVTFW